ncbi:hypothetical protein BCR35DRAFT_349217 [Leucosporidium creatinivorum]|uniref:HIT-type domain-containing protein n=1 Tax=Leucosporidium creatinivorum TaxID=106004 RepID=A0A1Y2G4N2_9BASI|nr:hypothetical protein BCR35DRAFT_349217 [Leucosporidium creatinivorum]
MQPQILLSSQDKRARRAPIVSGPQPICQGCKTQFSRYTCPSCNFHYCTLACFRSSTHSGCSEAFDRKSLLEDIKASGKNEDEKKSMEEMLRRFEEESLQQEEGDEEESEEDEEGEELRRRLDGVDLDSLSPDALIALLSPSQRQAFDSTLSDPTKLNALVSQEFEEDKPWWDAVDSRLEGEEEAEGVETDRPPIVDAGRLPPMRLDADGKVVVPEKLVYNIVAVLFAYVYTLRTFSLTSFSYLPSTSTERNTMAEMTAQLLPFLVEKSTLVLEDVGSALEYVVAREEVDRITPPLYALLLTDLETLLRPQAISMVSSTTFPLSSTTSPLSSHPSHLALTALSDLHSLLTSLPSTSTTPPPSAPLLQRPSSAPPPRNYTPAAQKLRFYISFLAHPKTTANSQLVGAVARRLGMEAERRRREEEERQESVRVRKEGLKEEEKQREGKHAGGAEGGPKIVEIE